MRNAHDLAIGRKPAPGDLLYVQGFVNTVDLETGADAFATPDGVARWLTHHGFAPPSLVVTEADRARIIGAREAVRALLLANHGEKVDPAAIATLDEVGRDAVLRVRFAGGGSAELAPVAAGGTGVSGALAKILAVIYDAMREGTWERLKACRNDTCQWAFYDASRNRSGNWCTMAVCGNRKKVEAHRQRQREDVAD